MKTLFQQHFQIAYVVSDLDRAMIRLRDRYGIAEWDVLDMHEIHGPDSPTRYIGNSYSGDVMIELIEPVPGVPSLYDGWAHDDPEKLRLHHLGFLVHDPDSFEAAKAQFAADGIETAHEGTFGDYLDYYYADTTPELGHYYELIHLKPAGKEFFDRVPRN